MKKSFPWLFLILSIIILTYIWDYISVPYNNSNTIIGQYYAKKINPLNDTLRGLLFIFIPIFLYSFTFLILNKDKVTNRIFYNNINIKNKNIHYLSFILILFSILEFLSLDYKNYLGAFDPHHEGTFLTAQLNFFSKNKIWAGTSFDYGFLGNGIGIIYSYLFNEYSIGNQRFLFKFLILLNKICLILISGKIVNSLSDTNKKEVLFLLLSLSVVSLASFYDHVVVFHGRMFLFLIFTLLIFKVVTNSKSLITSIIIGNFSLLSILFYWDIGTYINFLLILFLIYLFFMKKIHDLLIISISIILSWSIFCVFLPNEELKEFFNQYNFIINVSDYLLGLEYPAPFSDKSTRHTKALLLIIASGIFLVNYIFNTSNKENLNSKFILLFIFISSVVFFKSGLMRSDVPHIKYSSGLYTLLFTFFISYYLLKKINDYKIIQDILCYFEKKIPIMLLTILISFLFFFQNNFSNLLNTFDSDKNFIMLTNVDDKNFLDKDYYKFIKVYKDLTNEETCVQQFTDDNAIPYLVNKPTCTKYYANAHIIKNWTENDFIKELKITSPNYIVYASQINWFKSRKNAPNADKFILDNYSLFKDLSPWIIYKKN